MSHLHSHIENVLPLENHRTTIINKINVDLNLRFKAVKFTV